MSQPAHILNSKTDINVILPTTMEELPTQFQPSSQSTPSLASHIVASYDRKGSHIYTGTSSGHILVIHGVSFLPIYSFNCSSFGSIKSLCFARKGDSFLVNFSDRNIRVFRILPKHPSPQNIPPAHNFSYDIIAEGKFQDLVNKIHWKSCCFSADGDFVVAGSAHKASHNIYIWDRNAGNLVRILEGPQEGLLGICWHPLRPIIASISAHGVVYIWTTNFSENWSAFAPDFQELEENVEYIEKEDEFDEPDPAHDASKRKHFESEDVDISTIESLRAYASSDEEDIDTDRLHPSSQPFFKDISAPDNFIGSHVLSFPVSIQDQDTQPFTTKYEYSSHSPPMQTHSEQVDAWWLAVDPQSKLDQEIHETILHHA